MKDNDGPAKGVRGAVDKIDALHHFNMKEYSLSRYIDLNPLILLKVVVPYSARRMKGREPRIGNLQKQDFLLN